MPEAPVRVWKIRDRIYAPDTPESRRNYPDGEAIRIQKPTWEEMHKEGIREIIELPLEPETAVEEQKPEPEVELEEQDEAEEVVEEDEGEKEIDFEDEIFGDGNEH